MKTDCKLSASISPYIDGELSAEETGQIRRHLESCSNCRSQFETLSALDQQLAAMPSIAPSPDFDSALWREINAIEEKRRRRPLARIFPGNWFRGWRPVLATAVCLLIVFGTLLFTKHPGETGLTADDIHIARDLEFLADFEIVHHLDLLENWTEIPEAGEAIDA